jgi:CheY-like chemotaxis protein
MEPNKRALVVDDDELARALLSSILRDGGYEVFELPSPIGATQTILRNDISVLVLDVFMPSMDGDKFARLLRGNPKLSQLNIVLVSGASMEELTQIASRVSASTVIPKGEVRERLLDAANEPISVRMRTSRPPPK